MEGDDEEADLDNLANEFNSAQSNGQATSRCQEGEDVNISSSSRHDSQPIPLLANGKTVSCKDEGEKNSIQGLIVKKRLMPKVLCQHRQCINSQVKTM